MLCHLPVIVKVIFANSVNPDQTAPLRAVWSGSTLFAGMQKKKGLKSLQEYSTDNINRHFQLQVFMAFYGLTHFSLFVLRFYGLVNPLRSCRTVLVHILSPETDNCPSWIRGREKMTVENISWSIASKEWCRICGESNLRLPDTCIQADLHPTEPSRLAHCYMGNPEKCNWQTVQTQICCSRKWHLIRVSTVCKTVESVLKAICN